MDELLRDLPLANLEGPFREALDHGPVVLSAPTGSGKSTLAPLWCAAPGRRTLVIEPRRVACRALHRFVAAHAPITVGYAVRHEQESPDAGLLFVTPGVALRRYARSRLTEFEVVIVDEFHERRMDVDLLLAMLRDADEAHRLVVMSATLRAARVAGWLGATALEGQTRSYPVERHHLGDVEIPTSRGLAERVVAGVRQALALTPTGDVLVFLPGKGEIRDAESALNGRVQGPVLPLHAGLHRRDQDRVFEASARRRIILATNVAESSVTIPGVRAVVDSGLERRTTYRRARSVLSLSPISEESALQRAGRAGRLAPGVAVRLWSASGILRPDTPPEILREDLDPLLLLAGALGHRVRDLPFLDPPDNAAVQAAAQRLRRLDITTATGDLTPRGRRAARLPVDPQLAAILVEAEADPDPALRADVADLVAALSAPQPLIGAVTGPEVPGCDATLRIRLVRGAPLDGVTARGFALSEARRIARQLRGLIGAPDPGRRATIQPEALAALVLRADPGAAFVHRRKRFAGDGIEVDLARESAVSPEAEALVVLDIRSQRRRGLRAQHQAACAIPVTRLWLAQQGAGEQTLGRIRREAPDLVGGVRRELAGVVLAEREEILTGSAAVRAAARLIAEGRLLREVRERLSERLRLTRAWYAERGETPPDPLDPQPWLEHRLRQLGLTEGADLELLAPDDLLPDRVSEQELQAFADRYPVRLQLADRRCDVEYDFPNRTVELVHRSGNSRHPPPPSMLPHRWPGWKVFYRVHSRRYELQ